MTILIHDFQAALERYAEKYARRRQVRSSPGQQPLPTMGDANSKQHHLWREELHPRHPGGQFAEKGGASLPHQFGQGLLFHELASRLHHAEQSADPHVKSSQQGLFEQLAQSEVPPEQLAALLSGDQERLDALRNHAHATGQVEMPSVQPPAPASEKPPAGMPGSSAPTGAGGPNPPSGSSTTTPAHVAPVPAEPASTASEKRNPDSEGGFDISSPPPSDAAAGGFNPPAGDDARSRESGGGFALQQQPKKIGLGLGAEDKSPEISMGRQNAFFHGLNDAPGQGKMFEGMDLAGPAEPAKPAQRPSTHVNGDRAEYTGKMIDGMHELEMMEGLHAGTHRVTARGPDGSDPYADRNRKAWQDQQADFRKLHQQPASESNEPISGKPAEEPAKQAAASKPQVPAAALPPEPKPEGPLAGQPSMTKAASAGLPKVPAGALPPVQDFGEKIGGARKDTARPLGPRREKAEAKESSGPAWGRHWGVRQDARDGKWFITHGDRIMYRGGSKSTFDSKEEAKKALPLMAVAKAHRVYAEKDEPGATGKEKTYGIYRWVTDKKRALVKGGFESEEAAMKHMAGHPEEILSHKFPDWEDYSYLDTVTRTGKEHRKGDVKTDDFQKAFGFRGGEFGKWQMNKDGQTSLNHAYDALHDLADALKLPPKAMSLNGELAIGFGSRGTGGKHSAKAHYEPGSRAVINMTKMKGAGSLAHEWFHALDNYVAKKAQGKPESGHLLTRGTPYQHKSRPELVDAWKHLVETMHYKHSTEAIDPQKVDKLIGRHNENVDKILASIEQRHADDKRYNKRHKPFTPEQQKQWDELKQKIQAGDIGKKGPATPEATGWKGFRETYEPIEAMNKLFKASTGRHFHTASDDNEGKRLFWALRNREDAKAKLAEANRGGTETKRVHTDYARNAADLDKLRTGDYYSQPEEMAARAFAAYIQDKVEQQGHQSQYLTAKAHNKHYAIVKAKPYPESEEREAINAAFDKLFAALKHETRADEKGEHVHLY